MHTQAIISLFDVPVSQDDRSSDRCLDSLAARLQFILDRLQHNAEQYAGEMLEPSLLFETDVETTSRTKGRLDVMLADVIDELKASSLPSG